MNRLHLYDHLPAVKAIVLAWSEPGPEPAFHESMKHQVREAMPLLGRALDRAADLHQKGHNL